MIMVIMKFVILLFRLFISHVVVGPYSTDSEYILYCFMNWVIHIWSTHYNTTPEVLWRKSSHRPQPTLHSADGKPSTANTTKHSVISR